MGLNVDLTRMLGLPKTEKCQNCSEEIATGFDDYDIEVPSFNPAIGHLILHRYCGGCQHEWTEVYKVECRRHHSTADEE